MKRTFTFLSSLFLTIGAMWAQSEGYSVSTQLTSDQLNEKTEPTMIAIKNLSATNNAYFVGNTGGLPYSKAEFNANGEAVFVWEPVTEGTAGSYYLKKLDGTYMQSTSPKDFGAVESAAKFTTTNPTSAGSGSTKFNGDNDSQAYINGNDDPNLVRFVNNNGTWINVQNGNSGTPTYNSGQGGWTIHYAYAVEKVTVYNVTYNFTYNNEVKYTQTTSVSVGSAYPDYNLSSLPYGCVAVTAKPEGTVEETKTFEVELALELPVEAAETVEGITKWYFVKLHSTPNYGRKYIQALEDGTIEWADTEVAEGEEESHLWGFVGDVWGMKLVSKTGKAVVSTSGDALLGDAAQATAFVVTTSSADESGFCLQYPDKNYLNGQGGAVKSWSANDAGSTFLVELYEEPVVDLNDYTSYIKNADLSKTEESEKGWNTDGTKGIADGMVKAGSDARFDFSQTITLPAGQYKVAVKAAYRYGGDEAAEYAAIEAGTETHLVKLYAQTAFKNYEADVKNRWEGASDTDFANGSGSVTVNSKFVPNSSAAVQAWFDNGQYVNELVFNVQEESEVKLGLLKEAGITSDYTNIGAWTLTRIDDAEFDLNEEDFDLDAPAYTDVTADYIVNADMSSETGWTLEGLDGHYAESNRVNNFYAGWGGLDRTSAYNRQEITLPAGIYRLTGKAFFRQGENSNPEKSLGYMFIGENRVLVPSLASAGVTPLANNAGEAQKAFYTDNLYTVVLGFTLEEETTLSVGYECTFDEARSWFITGAMTLESVQAVPGALVPLFEAQATEFCQYSSQAMSSLPAVNAKWEALCTTVLEIYSAISANERVLDVEVKRVMDEMTAMTTELKAIEEAYATYNETKFAMFDIQDNSTPNNAEVEAAFDAAVDAASNVNEVATVAELEAKIAEFEAARQAYVVNAVPAEGFTFDYTFLIANPSFETGDLTGWTVRRYSAETDVRTDGAAGVDGRYCFNSWWNGVYLTQDLVDIPDGVYRITVALFGGDSGNDATAYIIANDDTLGVNLKNGNPYTDFSVETKVINGKLHFATVGGNDDDTAENPVGSFNQDGHWWYKADNFRLTYVGELPLEVVLPLKKELFLAKYAQFEALTETLDYFWNAINENYFTVQGTALGVKDTIDNVTEVAILNEMIAAMDDVTAMLDELGGVAADYNYFKGLLEEVVGFSTMVNEEECVAAAAALEQYGAMFGYTASSVEAVKAAVADLKASYIKFITNATPAEGTMFDVTFFITNASFETGDLTGWTVRSTSADTGVRENKGDHATNGTDGKYLFNSWWTGVYLTQEAEGLPNGDYRLTVAMSGGDDNNPGTAYIIANQDTLGINMPDKTVFVDHTVNFKVTDGKLHVATVGGNDDDTAENPVGSFNQGGYWWYKADNFRIEFAGTEKPAEVEVTEITLNTTWGELNEVGETLQLTATVTPENATDATITWSSSHPEIATVVDGLVTIVAAAQEQVEIKATAANGVSASCWLTVYVVEPGTVTGITLNTTWKDLEVKSGDTFQLVATVEPADATDKTVTWTSNADFATVDANGLVTFTGTPEDGGTVTITATASNGMTATCMLSVTFVADDTAIDNINANAETVIYDIHGRRVTEMTKGVYIVNGKKVVKK